MNSMAREKIAATGSSPGVYLMKDERGRIIYVGKAANLKKRLASYARPPEQLDVKTAVLVRQIADVDTMVTGSEKEALILEQTLIKRHRPRYNVILKDDKRYPSIRIDGSHPYPNLQVVRKIKKDGARYFGPFSSAHAVRQTLRFIDRTFRLRKCKDSEFTRRQRPCLHYQMDACLGPCCLEVDREVYADMLNHVIMFLSGRTPELIRAVRADMQEAAAARQFEAAAAYRDRMFALEKTLERQIVVFNDFKDRDALGLAVSEDITVATFLHVKNGYLVGSRHIRVPETLAAADELVGALIRQYYASAASIPPEILVPKRPDAPAFLEEELREAAGRVVRIVQPRRGEKRRLLELASRNAENHLRELRIAARDDVDLLARLQGRLKLRAHPGRIECIDNSNLMGTAPVAGLVVFENGRPANHLYRKYRIRTVDGPDDYATMKEVLTRRFGGRDDSTPDPDLLMVDGGKGQLNIAVEVMREMGITGQFDVIGIAKKDERRGETRDKVYMPGRANPVGFGKDGDLLLLLQRIRDETHRFAIGYHRQRRRRESIRSVLDDVPGIGPRRRKALLTHFGNLESIRNADVAALAAVPGMTRTAAEAVYRHLSATPPDTSNTRNSGSD